MNKLRSAVEHRPQEAKAFFSGELYEVAQCFSVDSTDEMFHGTKSSIQERLPSFQQPIRSPTSRSSMVIEASPIL